MRVVIAIFLLIILLEPVCADTVDASVRIRTIGGGGGGGTTTTQNITNTSILVYTAYPDLQLMQVQQAPAETLQNEQIQPAQQQVANTTGQNQNALTGALWQIPSNIGTKDVPLILLVSIVAFYLIISYLRDTMSRQSRRWPASRIMFKRPKR